MTRYFRSRFVNISNNQKYTALDIGSGKISCLIAKINNSGQIEIIGAGHQESKGLSVGTISDLKEFESAIRKCVESAEKMASETVNSVIDLLSATGHTTIEELNRYDINRRISHMEV